MEGLTQAILTRRAGLLVLGLLALLGSACNSSPQAPAMRASPVYHHKQLGFRFLVPEGWIQKANANLPDGALDKEICLTQFRLPSTSGASFEVLCFDRAYAPDILKYHGEPSQGISNWQLDGEPTSIEVEGAKGESSTWSATRPGSEKRVKDVAFFIRGERVFSFVALTADSDVKSREELRRALRSLVWEK